MKKTRLLLSILLASLALGSTSACTAITAWDDCTPEGVPGSNNYKPCE